MGFWLDASFLVALANPRDRHHKAAVAKLEEIEQDGAGRHTHALVLGELSAAVLKISGGPGAALAIREILDEATLGPTGPPAIEDAAALVERYGISLSDALLLQDCLAHDGTVVTFDADFKGKAKVL